MPVFHPDLAAARFIPKISYGPRLTRMMANGKVRNPPIPDDMLVDDVTVPNTDGLRVRLYRPKSLTTTAGAMLWFHGGGYVQGSLEQDERTNIQFARELGITVAAVGYRLAPAHPSPAAVKDGYAALEWLVANAAERHIDPTRIALGGASAGAGLAASLALYAHDKGTISPAFQLLLYPMLDDRTVTRTDHDTRHVRIWTPGSNDYAWTSYLGEAPGGANVSPYAAPSRRDDLRGLPPAWLGVGSLDLFHDEGVAYAARLNASGVACETYVVDGAFHAFDVVFPMARVTLAFRREQSRALRAALLG